jgi:molybdopterin-containing oxidoreductase family membrane subunit
MGFLGTLFLIGLIFYLRQFFLGLQVTGMGRDVSWGLYLANFTFLVGVAASAVMVVLPYYIHDYKQFRRLTTLGPLTWGSRFVLLTFSSIPVPTPYSSLTYSCS